MSKETVAVVGLGAMGRRMATRLAQAGYPLSVWSRRAVGSEFLKVDGVSVVPEFSQLAQGARFVLSMVSDDEATREVMLGEQGLFAQAAPGTVVIDSSTHTPALARELGQLAQERGIAYLDAPVSGSLGQANAGELVFMVGGTEAAFASAAPLFDVMGRAARHLGDCGTGAAMKLVNNMLTACLNVALSEAVLVGEAAGLSATALMDMLNEGACGSRLLRAKIPKMTACDFTPQFQLALMEKDIRYFVEMAKGLELPTPVAAFAHKQYEAALPEWGSLDMSSIIRRKPVVTSSGA